MVKQREHEALDRFAVLNKLSLPGEAAFAPDMSGLRLPRIPHLPGEKPVLTLRRASE
jgi:hypothetical protein